MVELQDRVAVEDAWVIEVHPVGPIGPAPVRQHDVLGANVPLHPGDSGGPLIDRGGRLVGINGAMRFSRFAAIFSPSSMQSLDYLGEAVAPDPDWIHSLIRADRRARKSRR